MGNTSYRILFTLFRSLIKKKLPVYTVHLRYFAPGDNPDEKKMTEETIFLPAKNDCRVVFQVMRLTESKHKINPSASSRIVKILREDGSEVSFTTTVRKHLTDHFFGGCGRK